MWLAAHTRESFDVAARLGVHAFTTNSGRPLSVLEQTWAAWQSARAEYGGRPDARFGVQSQIVVAPTDEEARAEMPNFLYASRQSTNLLLGRQEVVRGRSIPKPYEGEPDLDELFERRTLSGSPATVRRKLTAYTEVCDISQLNCTFQLGAMPPERIMRSMRMFAEEVMPAFR
jgi:alkanesulfonate monooxygenase SsuD/methylene tetrahydromethanopterin reductase-like flavin-dependent oxidoreductase (luciferase family)